MSIKRLIVAASLIVVMLISGAPAANAQTQIRAGDYIKAENTNPWAPCTVGEVGHWRGLPVAVTASHCFATGTVVVNKQNRRLGVFRNGFGTDYGFILLDENIRMRPTFSGVGSVRPGDTVCKNGNGVLNEGVRCGVVYRVSRDGICSTALLWFGDSGGPVYSRGLLVGLVSEFYRAGCGVMVATRADTIKDFAIG